MNPEIPEAITATAANRCQTCILPMLETNHTPYKIKPAKIEPEIACAVYPAGMCERNGIMNT